MHQESNITESMISMCLDVTVFSKDNMNGKKDLVVLCDRPSLEVKKTAKGNLTRPHAPYCLTPSSLFQVIVYFNFHLLFFTIIYYIVLIFFCL
jgi:hypothetical protein